MSTYSCLIIDDEELARDLLENYVNRVEHLELKGKFNNPLQALGRLKDESIDIIFLDIQMPEMTGIDFLKTLSDSPAIILTTAYDKYAITSYEFSVIDYLLKPFSFTRFLQAVNKATELVGLKNQSNSTQELPKGDFQSSEILTVKADHKVFRIDIKDLIYVESQKEYVVYHTKKDKIISLGSLKSLEEKLPRKQFMRVHKSYIVSIKHVNSLEGNELNLGQIRVPVGGIYRNHVVQTLF